MDNAIPSRATQDLACSPKTGHDGLSACGFYYQPSISAEMVTSSLYPAALLYNTAVRNAPRHGLVSERVER